MKPAFDVGPRDCGRGLALLTLGLVLAIPAAAQSTNPCLHALPAAADMVLQQHFPHDQIVDLSSLNAGELAAWTNHHRTDCPGIAHATVSPGMIGYAMSLVHRVSPDDAIETLVFLRQTPEGYGITILSSPQQSSGHTSVVSTAPPGAYRNWDTGRTRTLHTTVILYEAIEAGITGYYFAGGTFHSIPLSE
ncbi:MAG: hypothetical protein WA414_00250 [Acidobacteriaceae bacterium]